MKATINQKHHMRCNVYIQYFLISTFCVIYSFISSIFIFSVFNVEPCDLVSLVEFLLLWCILKSSFWWDIKPLCPVSRVIRKGTEEIISLPHHLVFSHSKLHGCCSSTLPAFLSGLNWFFFSWLCAQELLWAWPMLLTLRVASLTNDSRWN